MNLEDINRCDHEMTPIESDTVDIGPSSEWCPKCGLIMSGDTNEKR